MKNGNVKSDASPSGRHRVVVVGGGFGGLRVAKGLRRAPCHVTVIDRSNHHLFQPLLYQVATATLSPAEIASPIRSILRGQRNAEVLMAEVTGIDTAARLVKIRPPHDEPSALHEVPYDTLVLATGATHTYFGNDQWEEHAPGLKSVLDATIIRQRILLAFEEAEMEADEARRRELMHFILVGGGPTGVEMAGAIAELSHRALAADFHRINPRDARITLIEAGPRVLSTFPEKLSLRAQEDLQRLGVDVLVGSRVENIDAEGVWIGGKCHRSQTVIWTAGVQASPAGRWIDADTDRAGRVRVNPDLSVPGRPGIYVIGDTALAYGKDGKPLPGVAPVAMQQGEYLAGAIRRRLEGEASLPPFRYFDKGSMATIGRSSAVVAAGRLCLAGFLAWLAWLFIHILYLIGFRNRLLVLLEWAWSYLTFQRGARLIVARLALTAVIFVPLSTG